MVERPPTMSDKATHNSNSFPLYYQGEGFEIIKPWLLLEPSNYTSLVMIFLSTNSRFNFKKITQLKALPEIQ
jgi:hypothetical protein